MSSKTPATRRTQLLTLLYSMKQQGKESATFNINFLIEACQETMRVVHEAPENETRVQPGDIDAGQF